MPAPSAIRLELNGLHFQLYEWPGSGRPVFFAHATGFHARCWDEVVARLPGRRCIAIDMRGHGLSEKPALPYRWRDFGSDVAAAAEALDLEGAIAVGHSMGGHSVTLAAALRPAAFAALVLVDPVILAPEHYAGAGPFEGDHFAARRRNQWSSPEEMEARFRDRPPFATWDPRVLHDYCTHGLVPDPAGDGYVLACPPAIEAAIYTASANDGDIYPEIATVDVPVRVLRARERGEGGAMDMSSSPTAPGLAGRFPRGEDLYLPRHSHFIPMEDPALVAGEVVAMLARLGEVE